MVKFSQHTPPAIVWSHKNAVGLHCRNSNTVVTMQMMVVLTMQNHSAILCHLRMTMRRRNSATEPLDAAMPMMHMPWPMASHMMALE